MHSQPQFNLYVSTSQQRQAVLAYFTRAAHHVTLGVSFAPPDPTSPPCPAELHQITLSNGLLGSPSVLPVDTPEAVRDFVAFAASLGYVLVTQADCPPVTAGDLTPLIDRWLGIDMLQVQRELALKCTDTGACE